MASLTSTYRDLLKMKSHIDTREKGALFEGIAYEVTKQVQAVYGGAIFCGIKFPYARKSNGDEYPGNLRFDNGRLIELTRKKGNGTTYDEIDILYVNQFAIIAVECKAYGSSGGILLEDTWWRYSGNSEKYPLAQTEKHCRHLYHNIYELIPNGDPSYIKPVCAFIDKNTVTDSRSSEVRKFVDIAILAKGEYSLKQVLQRLSKPNEYLLHVEALIKKLNSISIGGSLHR